MCEVNRRREAFRDDRLVRLARALGPLANQDDPNIPLTYLATCFFGHRVSIEVVPTEWKEACTVSPPDLTALRSTPAEHQLLLATGLCSDCNAEDPTDRFYQ